MFLLMIVTIFYAPLVLPLLLPGVEVNAGSIAKSLIVTMLIPMVLGLLFKSHSPEDAQHWAPVMNKVAGVAMLIFLVTALGLNLSNIISLIGMRGFLALVLLILVSLGIGFVTGGRDPGVRSVMGLGTAQRNGTAAIVIVSLNFAGTMTLPYILVANVLMSLILLPTAQRVRQAQRGSEAAAGSGCLGECGFTRGP